VPFAEPLDKIRFFQQSLQQAVAVVVLAKVVELQTQLVAQAVLVVVLLQELMKQELAE
jgi:hypothetical protein